MKFGAWILLILVWGGPSGPVSPACSFSPTQLSCCDVCDVLLGELISPLGWLGVSCGWLQMSCGDSFPEIILVPDT